MAMSTKLTRRQFFARGTALGAAVAVSGTAGTLIAGRPVVASERSIPDYGPLVSDPDGLLDLPQGFHYRVVSRAGEPMASSEGVVPNSFDGQFAFAGRGPDSVLVRNHEIWSDDPASLGRVEAPSSHVYDPGGRAGTTTVRVDGNGRAVTEQVSLAGTFANCSGGHTPWHTWLSCEEELPDIGEKTHGWVFEVDPYDNSRNADPTPLKALGRFAHEAIAVDPRDGVLYLTEDDTGQGVLGLIYRLLPEKPLGGYGSLRAGGRLQAMRVPGVSDLSTVQESGTRFDAVDWVDVPAPEAASTPTRMQDYGGEVARSQKLEGIWWSTEEQVVYICSSYARNADGAAAEHDGQIWRYDPRARTMALVIAFTRKPLSADQVEEQPDQICASPYGGLMLCEDSGGESYVLATNSSGDVFPFARNRQNIGTEKEPAYGEFSGVVFAQNSPGMLFLNCYTPGTTFAIWGPWQRRT